MCIDSLEITFRDSRGGRGHDLNEEQIESIRQGLVLHPGLIDLTDVRQSLEGHGYRLYQSRWRHGNAWRLRYDVHCPDNLPLHVKLHGIERRNNYEQLLKVTANPVRFTSFRDFWAVVEAMDNHEGQALNNEIIQRGVISRIDYTCDYLTDIQTIMRGLYVDHAQTIAAYDDMDDRSYREYLCRSGGFESFRIGSAPRPLKVYDKRKQEARSQINTNRARRAQERVSWELDYMYQPGPLNDWADFYPANNAVQARTAEMSLPATGTPRTRLEISITQHAEIRRFWGRNNYQGRLRELPSHLQDICLGHNTPFSHLILHHVDVTARGLSRTTEAKNLRHEINLGFFMNVYKKLGGHEQFWTEHQRFFHLYPWQSLYQPTSVYAQRMRQWTENGILSLQGAPVPEFPHRGIPQSTDGWRRDLAAHVLLYPRTRVRLSPAILTRMDNVTAA